jgi:multidrug efflux pump subunit AcrA (membrane-fusion protein)
VTLELKGLRSRRALNGMLAIAAVVALVAGYRAVFRQELPDVPLAVVARGDFVERIDIRGEIRPVKSVLVTAPAQAGELLVVELVKTGTLVEAGDPIATFNPIVLRQQIEDKRAEVRQAEAEIERTRAQGRIQAEQNQTALLRAKYDIERARLGLGDEKFMARLDYERARLDMVNAEQRSKEIEKRAEAGRLSVEADVASRRRQREKVQDELERLEQSLAAMQVVAPAAGTVNLMMNGRGAGPMIPPTEFREGDRIWAGAAIAELPDLSSVFVRAQLDEDSRGRLRIDQPAVVKLEAIPDRELRATVTDISVLARIDFRSSFPPPRNFDLKVRIDDMDPRLRPGMTATARIEVDRLKQTLLVPASAVFDIDGRSVVYQLKGSAYVESPIEVARRSREQVAVAAGLVENDRVATARPPDAYIRRGK